MGTAEHAPVLMIHGIASNSLIFDFSEKSSLAETVARRGHAVYSLDLRGWGLSKTERSDPITLDDFLKLDLPAAISRIAEIEHTPELHLVGHSMGGILAYALLGTEKHGVARGVVSLVCIAAALDYSGSGSVFERILTLLPLARGIKRFNYEVLAAVLGRLPRQVPRTVREVNFWPENMDDEDVRSFYLEVISNIPAPLLAQLASAVRGGGLRSIDGSVNYLEHMGAVDVPVLSLAGDMDPQCPPAAAKDSFDRLGAREKGEFKIIGRETGYPRHYGHMDLLISRYGAEEVHPLIVDWLE